MESLDMQHQMMGYDRAATTFSPDGHILQVEYAEKTVRLGSASIGFVTSDGVVIIADKKINDKLIVGESANKIFEVDEHIMGSAAGILSDARVLIEKSQVLAQQNRITYDSPVDILSIVKDISNVKQQFTQHPGVRPFGVAIMVAGVDNKPGLYVSDITGNYVEYMATAIGENDEKIKEELRKHYKQTMNSTDVLKLGMKIFKDIKGKSFNIENFDAAIVAYNNKRLKRINAEELKRYMK